MQVGRVIGKLWCSVKNPTLEGQRLLVVQPCLPDGAASGRPIVCTDSVGAGAGELIYWCRGSESSFPFLPVVVPTDATIVGIIDGFQFGKKEPA